MYDDDALYVIWRVEDAWVRAVAQHLHDRVWRDSCVEMFFTPGPEVSAGYFNLEINCGGVMLFASHLAPRDHRRLVFEADCAAVDVYHSLPSRIDVEIAEPTTWTVAYRLPFRILHAYLPVTTPAPGARWRANLYKCADESTHPHWLTWAPIESTKPDFHRPDSFGVLEFD
jgi:hypothetical protein